MRASGWLLLAGVLLLSACESGKGAADAPADARADEPIDAPASAELPPDGSRWLLVSGLPDKLPADVAISLQFGTDGSISGNGGCNLYRSHMSLDGYDLSVSPVVASKRGCMGAAGELEPQYFAALAKVTGLSADASTLRLALSDGGELVFEANKDSAGK